MNKKTFAMLSLIFALIPAVLVILPFGDKIHTVEIIALISLGLEILAVIFGALGMKGHKGMSVAGIIIGIIASILMGLCLLGIKGIKEAKDCVPAEKDNYKCKIMGQEIDVPGKLLRDDQKITVE